MIDIAIHRRVPPAQQAQVKANLHARGIVVSHIGHRVQRDTSRERHTQTLNLVLAIAVEGSGRNAVLAKTFPIVQLKGVDILRTNIRVANLGRIEIAIGDVRLHIEQLRTGSAARIGGQQAMLFWEGIAHMEGREKLKPVLHTVGPCYRAAQHSVRMLAPDARLRL